MLREDHAHFVLYQMKLDWDKLKERDPDMYKSMMALYRDAKYTLRKIAEDNRHNLWNSKISQKTSEKQTENAIA